jgi:hypothetical protein
LSDGWYLDAAGYYVAADRVAEYPLRQGDVVAAPKADGESWVAALILHPTCELGKRSVKRVQVARVRTLDELADDFERSLVVAGYREVEGGRRVAAAHTFFLAPWEAGGPACFASFRELGEVSRAELSSARRLAALTHDCRVTLIRRYLYFRFRLAFRLEDVRAWEAQRIANDPHFEGPRPTWAGP